MHLCYVSDLTLADASNLVRLYTNDTTRKYLGGPLEVSLAQTRAHADINTPSKLPIWAIRSSTDHNFLGIISLDTHHDGSDIEVSYELLPEYMGYGYATQALEFVLNYSFNELNLKKVIAETQTQNKASIKLLERVGMVFEKSVERFGSNQSIFFITSHQYIDKHK
ncbi:MULTISPECIES: GNAT family N-acetyltransferase [Acinetobacter]|jgi:[ribosomal protein S5]-alanine N-acetyltransferase|uniref:GNAT family N-acetyltransferase n=3 Tax=Acinetobacter nosocomialis TaxID=106654 RepID=A0A2L1VKY6_ACINO|nr:MULTISPECIES: GNAT family N-acetyltransferase [Acinetobacter]SSQ38122.1 acetyltransferase (GNAT) family protein [Acinetobacter baumannii]ARG18648.1 GNAT family N-acetyltransferase [Acinetobacter nosocomialis]AVF45879.1 GNAT family N-acetyltransferase [Acinetobacter nosocomialis]AZC03438.1 N-acetyltransferase [Acinetobacter nosocomialis]AZC10657.1 N-acetyltransferase [Acinetobacter nosocomialis]